MAKKPEKYTAPMQVMFKPSQLLAIRKAAEEDPTTTSASGWIRAQALKELKSLGLEYY